MIHPRSLSWREPRPKQPEWVCSTHGVLPAGETRCAECEKAAA